jgi:uncharacterized protein (DUF2147 family)
MKKTLLTALAGILIATQALADPIYGIWQTAKDDNGNYGHIEVSACDDKICGTLIKSFDGNGTAFDSENVGKLIIWDMKSKGGGKYGGGKVWSPDRDKTYSSKLVMDGDVIKVSGCVLVVCRDGGTWTRVE